MSPRTASWLLLAASVLFTAQTFLIFDGSFLSFVSGTAIGTSVAAFIGVRTRDPVKREAGK